MKLLINSVQFETKVGLVLIGKISDTEWGFEFTSGYANGLHNAKPLKGFDAAYMEAKRQVKRELSIMKHEI